MAGLHDDPIEEVDPELFEFALMTAVSSPARRGKDVPLGVAVAEAYVEWAGIDAEPGVDALSEAEILTIVAVTKRILALGELRTSGLVDMDMNDDEERMIFIEAACHGACRRNGQRSRRSSFSISWRSSRGSGPHDEARRMTAPRAVHVEFQMRYIASISAFSERFHAAADLSLLRRHRRGDRVRPRRRGASAPRRPGLLGRRLDGYLFVRRNPRGVHFERWRHAFGCGKWFHVARCTATLEVFGSYPADVGAPPDDIVAAIRARRPDWEGLAVSGRLSRGGLLIDRDAPVGFRLERQGVAGLRRRHARLGAARQRPGAGRAVVQVPPAARHRRERRRGAERAGRARRRRGVRAEHPCDHGGAARGPGCSQPEPLAEPRMGSRRRRRQPRPAPAGGVLLQDLHPPARRLEAAVRAGDPPLGRARRRAGGGGSGQLRLRLCTCRRAGGRRRGRRSRGGGGGGRLGGAGDAGRAGRALGRPGAGRRRDDRGDDRTRLGGGAAGDARRDAERRLPGADDRRPASTTTATCWPRSGCAATGRGGGSGGSAPGAWWRRPARWSGRSPSRGTTSRGDAGLGGARLSWRSGA